MAALPSKHKLAHLAHEAQQIKGRIDGMISKMHKEHHFTPTRDQLGEFATQIIAFINDHHAQTKPYESYLKAAIIDLTEVPEMAPQMQRIAFLTSLKDASKELNLFLSCC